MTTMLAKFVSKRILGERLENKFGREDPFFEQVPATRLDGTPTGKFKKQRKALPPGISDHDGQILTKVKRRAYRLDMSLCNCCGIRFGWSSVIGLVPAVGDILDAFMAMMVVHTCAKVEGGLPSAVKMRMYMNILLDFGVGLVPFLGDVVDALFRANTRNAVLLENYLREKGKKNLRQSGVPIPAIDPSDPADFDRLQSESPPHYTAAPPSRNGAMSAQPARGNGRGDGGGNGGGNGNSHGHSTPSQPAAARVRDNRNSMFGFVNRTRPHDLEMGVTSHEPKATVKKSDSRPRRS